MAKVGFLYTIGMLLMALTVFSLALLVTEIQRKSNENVAEIIKYERLYNLDTSINEGFAEIFRVASGIRFIYNNKTNNTLFIEENLTSSNQAIFAQNMSRWGKFLNKTVTNRAENVSIHLSNFNAVNTRLPLVIMPYNINYEHIPNLGGSTLRLSPMLFNFYGYNISVYSPIDVLSTSTWREASGTDMIIKIKVRGPATSRIINQRISSTGLSYLQVRNLANTANLLNISINNSKLYIDKFSTVSKIKVTTGIIMPRNNTELTRIFYPKKIYNVTLTNLSVKTVSDVMLLSLQV